jgi:cytidine deaminase
MMSDQMSNVVHLDALFDAAIAAAHKAYAPYSEFPVGAAILSESGAVYRGCNVENAAYPVGTCAEAGAIAAMISGGDCSIWAIAIFGVKANPCMPCGACRQRIAEFSNDQTLIVTRDEHGVLQQHRIGALLPHAFGPGS